MRRAGVSLTVVLAIATFVFALPSSAARTRAHGKTVEYWVGAVTTNWNVVPTGKDPMTGLTFDPAKTTMNGTAVYRLFTANWGSMLPAGKQGLVGPILKARAGDKMLVHFKNFDTTKPHSMHFHGVHYDVDSDGAYIPGISGP